MERELAVDLIGADMKRAGRQRPRTADSFRSGLTRQQHFRSMRLYGDDFSAQRIRENLATGPVSVEFVDDVMDRPIFKKPVVSPDFDNVPGREREGKHSEPPARRRLLGRSARFSRSTRSGETRCKVQQLSRVASAIAELRATRTFEALL